MATLTPAVVQNENVHIPGKPQMATQTSAIVQNENVHIPKGKGIEGVKVDLLKAERKERKDRKALRDLSRPAQPVASAAPKASTLKKKSSLHHETTKKAPKNIFLTDDEIKKCQEWAKEGIEKVHYTGNDIQENEREINEKRVQKEVDMVMSCMNKWNQVFYDYVLPKKKATEDITILELKPEALLPVASLLPTSGVDDGACLFLEEPKLPWPCDDPSFDFEIKMEEDSKDDTP